ncbi:hypothetical protein GCM10009635_55460 [Actinocatenispora thailandica]
MRAVFRFDMKWSTLEAIGPEPEAHGQAESIVREALLKLSP